MTSHCKKWSSRVKSTKSFFCLHQYYSLALDEHENFHSTKIGNIFNQSNLLNSVVVSIDDVLLLEVLILIMSGTIIDAIRHTVKASPAKNKKRLRLFNDNAASFLLLQRMIIVY